MPGAISPIRKGVAFLAFAILPISVHVAMATGHGLRWVGLLISAQAAIFALIALSFVPAASPNRTAALRWAGSLAVFLIAIATWRNDGIVAASAIPHAIAYFSLLVAFGASLLPGRKPLVTGFAEKSRGTLSPAVRLYTRRVTWAWCLFCAGQLLASMLLLLFARISIWSTFINVCNLPLLATMVCGEFAWRKWRHGSAPWERLTDGLRMTGRSKAATGNDAG